MESHVTYKILNGNPELDLQIEKTYCDCCHNMISMMVDWYEGMGYDSMRMYSSMSEIVDNYLKIIALLSKGVCLVMAVITCCNICKKKRKKRMATTEFYKSVCYEVSQYNALCYVADGYKDEIVMKMNVFNISDESLEFEYAKLKSEMTNLNYTTLKHPGASLTMMKFTSDMRWPSTPHWSDTVISNYDVVRNLERFLSKEMYVDLPVNTELVMHHMENKKRRNKRKKKKSAKECVKSSQSV